MRASTRLRVSAPTSAQPRTTLETVITLTFRSCAISFKRTGFEGAWDMIRGCETRSREFESRSEREYIKLRTAGGCRRHRRGECAKRTESCLPIFQAL